MESRCCNKPKQDLARKVPLFAEFRAPGEFFDSQHGRRSIGAEKSGADSGWPRP
jgi:hypothetical protein